MSDIVQDSEGQTFVVQARGRSASRATFGWKSLRSALGHAASMQSILNDSGNRTALTKALVDIGEVSSGEATSLTMEEIRPLIEQAIGEGSIVITPYTRNLRPIANTHEVGQAEDLAEGLEDEETLTPTHTLELELVDEDDEPVPFEPYRVELPGGQIINGRLNGQGLALLTGIQDSGNCKVTFPKLDEQVWEPT